MLFFKGTQSAGAHAHQIPFLSWFAYYTSSQVSRWEAHPLKNLNKPCRVEVFASQNSDYRPNVILEHSFSWYHGEFTDGLVQGKPNVNEYLWSRRISWSEKHIIVHFCFQSDILIYDFVSTTSPLSKFRNQTHVIARALARPVENKVLIEVVLVEEIIDCLPKLVFIWAPNQVAMTRSSNRLQTFSPHEPFARLRKCDFSNIYNSDLLSNVFDWFLSLF